MSKVVKYMHKVGDKAFLFETYEQPLRTQIEQLKQELAEKDKEIEKLTEELDYKNFWNDFVDLYTGNKLKTQMLHENCKDKISFAVEQLEKVKEFFLEEHRDEEMDTDYLITKDAGEIADYLLDQIKQLKEGK